MAGSGSCIYCVCVKGIYIAMSSIGSTPFVVFVLFCAFRPMFVCPCVCFLYNY